MKDNEFEKRFLYLERDLIRENKFSIAKSELGKIIHDAKIKNLSEVLDRARELLRLCNSKEREFSKKIDESNHLSDDEASALLYLSRKDIDEKEKLIKEQLSKAKNLFYQKKALKKKLEGVKYLEKNVNKLNVRNFIQNLSNVNEFPKFMQERSKLFGEMYSFYNKHKNYEDVNKEMTNLFIRFYSPYFKINPFEIEIHFFTTHFVSWKDSELRQLKNIVKENIELEILYNKLEKIDYNFMIDRELEKIAGEIKELNYDVPLENMYYFLLDFSQIIIDPDISKTDNSTEDEYTLKTSQGPMYFKIKEKDLNKKLVYDYDFLSSTYGEKGRVFIDFSEPTHGKVILKIKNEIQEISKEKQNQLMITNLLGAYLKQYIDMNLGKIIAKQLQAIIYEKDFDDLTIGNFKILQAKIGAMGKDINKLKQKFYEVKAPFTLTSFNCSECGATLNITSNEEKFIICEHCDTPFLMEWQKK